MCYVILARGIMSIGCILYLFPGKIFRNRGAKYLIGPWPLLNGLIEQIENANRINPVAGCFLCVKSNNLTIEIELTGRI